MGSGYHLCGKIVVLIWFNILRALTIHYQPMKRIQSMWVFPFNSSRSRHSWEPPSGPTNENLFREILSQHKFFPLQFSMNISRIEYFQAINLAQNIPTEWTAILTFSTHKMFLWNKGIFTLFHQFSVPAGFSRHKLYFFARTAFTSAAVIADALLPKLLLT